MTNFIVKLSELSYIPKKGLSAFKGDYANTLKKVQQDIEQRFIPSIQHQNLKASEDVLKDLNPGLTFRVLSSHEFNQLVGPNTAASYNAALNRLSLRSTYTPDDLLHEGIHSIQYGKYGLHHHQELTTVIWDAEEWVNNMSWHQRTQKGNKYLRSDVSPQDYTKHISRLKLLYPIRSNRLIEKYPTHPTALTERMLEEVQAYSNSSISFHHFNDMTRKDDLIELNFVEERLNGYLSGIRSWNSIHNLNDKAQRAKWFKEKLEAVDRKSDRFVREQKPHKIVKALNSNG